MSELIHFNRVTKIFDNKIPAVTDVDFKIDQGEFVFLIGPSGSGKTTIIKMLIRDLKPTMGRIFFKEKDITKIGRGKVYKLRRSIGVIFQDFKLISDKTAYENVAFAMEVAGKRQKEIKNTVPYVLDVVGLSHRMDAFPKQLSGGEQQRVAIARAIANNPELIIADEPTGNLDPASAWDIVQVLTKINNWGTTVLMSTHGTEIVNALNKRVIQMDKGRIIRDDNKGKYEIYNYEESLLNKISQIEEITDVNQNSYPKKFVLNLDINKSESLNTSSSDSQKDKNTDISSVNIGKNKNILSRILSVFKRKTETSKETKNNLQIENTEPITEQLDQKYNDLDVVKEDLDNMNININDQTQNHVSKNLLDNNFDLSEDKEPTIKIKVKRNKPSSKSQITEVESKQKNRTKNSKTLSKKEKDSLKGNKEENNSEVSIITYKDIEEKLKKNKGISVSKLNISKETIKKLKKGDILTIEDLVKCGVDGLSTRCGLDQDEIIDIAKEIDRYLA